MEPAANAKSARSPSPARSQQIHWTNAAAMNTNNQPNRIDCSQTTFQDDVYSFQFYLYE